MVRACVAVANAHAGITDHLPPSPFVLVTETQVRNPALRRERRWRWVEKWAAAADRDQGTMASPVGAGVRRTVTKSLVANTASTPSIASTAAAKGSSVSSPVAQVEHGRQRPIEGELHRVPDSGVVLGSALAMGQPRTLGVARIRVETTIEASPSRCGTPSTTCGPTQRGWGRRRRTGDVDPGGGVGTAFDCDTKVGPLRLTDKMTITRWDPAEAMGVPPRRPCGGRGGIRLT